MAGLRKVWKKVQEPEDQKQQSPGMWAGIDPVAKRKAEKAERLTDMRSRSSISAKALEFAILTAGRSGEVRGATWFEIDLKARVWHLSAGRMKADKSHKVPLSEAAVAILQALPRGPADALVFPGFRGRELSDASMGKVLKVMHTSDLDRKGPGYLDPDQSRQQG